jgi:hypothetical protein
MSDKISALTDLCELSKRYPSLRSIALLETGEVHLEFYERPEPLAPAPAQTRSSPTIAATQTPRTKRDVLREILRPPTVTEHADPDEPEAIKGT